MKHKLIATSLLCLALGSATIQASTLYWSGNGSTLGGAGAWNTTAANWGTSTSGPFTTVWNNANSDSPTLSAGAGATGGGIITLGGPITMNGTLTWQQTPGTFASYSISGASIMTFSVGSAISCNNSLGGSLAVGLFNCPYAGTITKTGTGQLEFNNANGNVTKFILNAGTASYANVSRFGTGADAADFITFNGGSMRPNTTLAWTMGKSITVNSGGGTIASSSSTITITQNKPITWSSGNLTLQVSPYILTSTTSSGSGTLTLANGLATTCNAAGVIPSTVVLNITTAGSTFTMNGFNQTVKAVAGTAGTVSVGAAQLTISDGAGQSFSSVFSGTGKVIMSGIGAQTLSGSSTGWTGEWVINSGTIGVAGANIFGNAAGATVTINGGKLGNNSATGRTIPSAVVLNISGDFTVDDSLLATANGQILFNGPATLKNGNRTITVQGTSTSTPNLGLAGAVGEDASGRGIIKNGLNGTLALNAVNTYSGNTTINAGTINLNASSTLGSGAGTLYLSGGKLQTTASRTSTVPNPINVTADSVISTSSTAATVDCDFTTSTLAATAGTTLTFRNDAASGTGVWQPRFSAGGFTYGQNIAVVNGSFGTTILQSYNTTGTDQTFTGVISGTGSYKRNASVAGTGGRTIFTGANTYSGGTTVSRGTLQVDNTTGSGTGTGAVTVSSDGTLTGIGTISGATTVSGTLAPGDAGIGTLTFGNSLGLSGTTTMEINKTLATADKIVMSSGTVTLGGNLTVVNLAGTLALGDTFDLIDGTIAGTFGSFTLPSLATGLAWDTSHLSAGGDGTIRVACDGTLAAHAGPNQDICSGSGVVIGGSPTATSGSGTYTYSWSPGTGLSSTTVANPTASPTSTTTYTVTVSDSVGCTTGTSSMTVYVNAAPTISAQPANTTVCSGSAANFSVTAAGSGLAYSWAKISNGGWGSAWAVSGSGGTFRGTSTDNNFGDPACTSFSAAFDINSPSGNAIGMWGGASGDTVATRTFTALAVGQVVSIDFDNGNVDTPKQVGFSLEASGGADVLQFYFVGGQANYKYWDTVLNEQDSGIPFQRTGLRVQFVLTSASTYSLIVTPCGGTATTFTGTYSGTIAQLKLFNQNTSGGNDYNIYFNNFLVGGYTDNADNYAGDPSGLDKGNQPIVAGNGASTYTTPALTVADSGTQYQVVVSGCAGSVLSSVATVTVNPPATVDAGPAQTVCASSPATTLAGSFGGAASSATWTGAGTFTPNATTLNAVYTPTAGEIAAHSATVTLTTDDPAGPCPAVSASMTITINPVATVNAGPNQAVCDSSPTVTLAGSFGGAASSATWSGAGTFTPDNLTLNATYTPTAGEITAGTATVTLTSDDPAGPCGAVSAPMTITINQAATASAGGNQTICAGTSTAPLGGVVGGGATGGTWSSLGTGTFSPNATTLNATYNPSPAEITAGTANLTLTSTGQLSPCGAATASVVVTINPAATVSAGPNQTVCASSPATTLAGSFGGAASSATWTGAGTFTPNATTLNAVYTPTAGEITAGTATVTLTTDDPAGPCGAVSASMTITINQVATVNAGPAQTVCASSPATTLAGSFGGAASSATWTGLGTFTPNATTMTAVYTPTAGEITAGTATVTLTTDDPAGPCGAVNASMTITIDPAATVSAGPNQSVCASSPAATLAGSFGGAASSATWTGAGTFTPNATTLNATYTPTAGEITAGTATVTLTTDDPAGPCGAVNASMTITINPVATASAGGNQTICAGTSTAGLGGVVGGGATGGTWSSLGTGTFSPNATTLNATYTPSPAEITAGTANLTLTSTGQLSPCGAATANVVVTINPAATVNAGPNQTVCGSSPATTLAGSFGGAASSATWTGAGTFTPNATTLNAVYTPTAGEITAGTATVTLTTDDPTGPCGAVSASMTITIRPSPTAAAGSAQTVCAGSLSAIGGSPTASGGTGPYTYSWSPATGLSDATVANPNASVGSTTTYTVTVTDANGCTASASVVLTVIPEPVIESTTFVDPDVVLVWSSLAGQTYRVQYTTDVAPSPVTWTDLTGPSSLPLMPDVTASGATATYTDAAAPAPRFYRIKIVCP